MVTRAADCLPGMLAATRKAICVSVLFCLHRTLYDVFSADRDVHHRRPSLFRDLDVDAGARSPSERANSEMRHGLLRGYMIQIHTCTVSTALSKVVLLLYFYYYFYCYRYYTSAKSLCTVHTPALL